MEYKDKCFLVQNHDTHEVVGVYPTGLKVDLQEKTYAINISGHVAYIQESLANVLFVKHGIPPTQAPIQEVVVDDVIAEVADKVAKKKPKKKG